MGLKVLLDPLFTLIIVVDAQIKKDLGEPTHTLVPCRMP